MKKKFFPLILLFILCFHINSFGLNKNRVLVIYSYSPTFNTYAKVEKGIESVFNKEDIEIDLEYMDTKRFYSKENINNFYNNISYKLENTDKYDLIMTVDDNALTFVENNYNDLFNNIPVVFSGVNNTNRAKAFNENPNFTGVVEKISLNETIDNMIAFQENIKNLYFIIDDTPSSNGSLEEIKKIEDEYKNLNFQYISLKEMSFEQLYKKIGKVHRKDAILLVSAHKDVNKQVKPLKETIKEITHNANGPVYHLWEIGIGEGITGGKVVNFYEQGKTAATMALDILKGKDIKSMKVIEASPNVYMYDYKQLMKNNIPFKKIPPKSVVINKPFGELAPYKTWIKLVGVFCVISIMAIGILIKNILERKKIANDLIMQKSYFEQLYKKSPKAILILDDENRVEHYNESFVQLFSLYNNDIKDMAFDSVAKMFLSEEILNECKEKKWIERLKSGSININRISTSIDGVKKHLEVMAYAIKHNEKILGTYIICDDITDNKKREETIEYLAYKDTVTDLYNRRFFKDNLKRELEKDSELAIMFLDLDGFKKVNDTLGHAAGDIILKSCSQRLRDIIGENEIIARMGGDEFIALFKKGHKLDGILNIGNKIISSIEEPFYTDQEKIYLSASLGIAKYPEHGQDSGTLIKNADIAMYRSKKNKEEKIQIYSHEFDKKIQKEFVIENKLRGALSRNEISVNYQPILDTETNKIIGCESLVRWFNEEIGQVSPFHFIPIAEQNGMIHQIGRWVLLEACKQNKRWHDLGYDHMFVAVNVSVKQLEKKDFAKIVIDVLNETNLDPKYLELEITESVYMENMNKIINVLKELDKIGVKFSIDDFGTGYSSLGELTRLDISKLKIDRSFIKDVFKTSGNTKVVEAIISMANSLNLNIVAEGVETKEQFNFLKNQQCNMVQGYLFSKPVEAVEFEDLLKNQ